MEPSGRVRPPRRCVTAAQRRTAPGRTLDGMTTTDDAPRAGDEHSTTATGSVDVASLADWLAARSDDELVTLLELRPDLAVPLPSSMSVLAARAEQRASVLRATDELDTLDFAVIETLAVHHAAVPDRHTTPLPRARLHELLGDRVARAAVDAAVDRLTARALAWGTAELYLVAAAKDALPWPLGSTTEIPDALTEPEIVAALSGIGSPNGHCWTNWRPPGRGDALATPRRARRRTGRSSVCWRRGCSTGSTRRPSNYRPRWARCYAANRSPTRTP